MPATVTTDGTVGPGNTLVDQVFNGVTSFTFKVDKSMLTLTFDSGRILDIALLPALTSTTILVTAPGPNPTTYTLSIQLVP